VWEDARLHPRTIEALRRADAAGLRVVVVTGRMVKSIRQALAPAGVEAPVIAYQGAVVADEDGRWLRHEPIPLDLAREIIAALADEGHSPNVYVDDELYVADDTQEARAYASLNRVDFHVVGPLLDWLSEPPTKLVCVGEPWRRDPREPRL
jgi:HAD superfamily hydrolase (TIGR01484 family)